MIWHSSDINDIKAELMTDLENGLSAAEIASRIQKYGQNITCSATEKSFSNKILKRFTLPLNIVLVIISLISMVVNILEGNGGWYASIIVLAVMAFNTVVDVLINTASTKEMNELRGSITLWAKVKRDGEIAVIDSAQIVPGDIVLLEAGDYIPADGRILEAHSLICEESAISGDHAPSEKQADFTPEDICPIEDRKNMVHAGCSVIFGSATIVVTDTAIETELGRKASLIEQTVGTDIAITRRLQKFAKNARIGVLVVAFLIFLLGVILNSANTESFGSLVIGMLYSAFSVAVAAAPEMLYRVVELAVGFGSNRILNKKTTVKNMQAIEELGCASVIVSDKTGTLTKNRMKMTMVFDGTSLIDLNKNQPTENGITLIRTGALCCNGKVVLGVGGKEQPVGDPTEVGIVSACMEYCGLGKDEIENIYPRMDEVPFDSDRKLMTTINMINNRPFAIVKGSTDILIECCTAGNLKGAAKATEEMAKRGLRTIAVAIKPLDEVPSNPNPDNMECDLTLLGLFGLTDKISSETTCALRESELAGIRTVMITGDHITAAEAIAKDMGILKADQRAITGEELGQMSDEELQNEIENISVYSRITTEDKLRIINAWQASGKIVAMTGDSVEDAAVLQAADIGCAMGINGTDIAKGSADVVLDEDSYISIVGAVKEARGIYANIKHMTSFIISSSFGMLVMILLGTLIFGAPLLSPLSMLWISLIMAYIPAIALASEAAGKCVVNAAPRAKKDSFFREEFGISLIWQSLMMALIGIIAYAIGNCVGAGSSVTFGALILSQVTLAFGLRSDISVIKEGIHKNNLMLVALGIAIVTIILVLATPLRDLFNLAAPTDGTVWGIVLLPLIPLAVTEAVKFGKELWAGKK